MKVVFLVIALLAFSVSAATAQSIDLASVKDWSEFKPRVSDPEKWYRVYGKGSADAALVFRPASVRLQGNMTEVWTAIVRKSDSEVVQLVKWQLDCPNKKIRMMYLIAFYEPDDERGQSNNAKLPGPKTIDVTAVLGDSFTTWLPQSIGEAMANAACSLSR